MIEEVAQWWKQLRDENTAVTVTCDRRGITVQMMKETPDGNKCISYTMTNEQALDLDVSQHAERLLWERWNYRKSSSDKVVERIYDCWLRVKKRGIIFSYRWDNRNNRIEIILSGENSENPVKAWFSMEQIQGPQALSDEDIEYRIEVAMEKHQEWRRIVENIRGDCRD